MLLGWIALGLRVVFVGLERILLRALGDSAPADACAAAFFGVGALVLLPFVRAGSLLQGSFLRLAVPAGLVYAVGYWLYVSALVQSEVSAAAPLASLSVLFVVILARIFYGEPLSPGRILGAVLITAGAATVRAGAGHGALPGGAAVRLVVYALLTAVVRMVDKASAAGGPGAAGTYAFLVFAVTALSQVVVLLASGRVRHLVSLARARPGTVLAAGIFNGGSFLLLILALGRLPVSVAEPLTACSLLVTAGAAALWRRERVGARLLPTLGVIAGSWFLVRSVH